ncbi:MAG: histidine phosphatase family protein [Pseudomonadota bacterium]
MADGTIWWVRHGPTHAKGMVGWTDLPADLSDDLALQRLSAALPDDLHIVSSDLSRTVATADAIAGPRPRLTPLPALREMHFGAWEMRGHAEIEAEDPERIRAFWDRPGEVRPPGGESWNELGNRVSTAVDGLLQDHSSLIAVAHFGVILSELQRVVGWDGETAFSQRIDPLSLTRIDYATGEAPLINHRA